MYTDGIQMVFGWYRILFRWYSEGIRMVFEWYPDGVRIVFSWYSNGIQIVFGWYPDGAWMSSLRWMGNGRQRETTEGSYRAQMLASQHKPKSLSTPSGPPQTRLFEESTVYRPINKSMNDK